MMNFLPLFPLQLTVFPGEPLHLHIFEERYKQLINDCYGENKPFGIPLVLNNQPADWGTLVEITSIAEVYADGRMDIKTKGIQVFNIMEWLREVPGKLYYAGIVHYPNNSIQAMPALMLPLLEMVRKFHEILQVQKDFGKPDAQLTSYDIAHHVGLNLEQEHQFIQLLREEQRLTFLKRHVQQMLDAAMGIESLKHRIQMNGHFKELKGFQFE
ncbi:MAG TPA: peptidase S16 [Chitinophagaceae bacterium]|nr:peptidase S16 [Chitinophagaceae bacterium]HAN39283.1 peptidase S16 [Chitinophagaceae bacterium]